MPSSTTIPAAREPGATTTQTPADTAAAFVTVPPGLPTPAPHLEQAPPPREAEDTRCYRSELQMHSYPVGSNENVTEDNGLEWGMTVGVRRLVSTGRDMIEFRWQMKYIGQRAPLIIRRPSLEYEPGTTVVKLCAFPPGKQEGRWMTFTAPENLALSSDIIFRGPPANWFLTVGGGEPLKGTETIFVSDVKAALQAKYPAEFTSEKPPKFYAEFVHNAWDRGWHYKLDAWTGELGHQDYMEVPISRPGNSLPCPVFLSP